MARSKRKRNKESSSKNAGAEQDNVRSVSEAIILVVRLLREHPYATPFNQPVSPHEAPDYNEYISDPIDLGTINDRALAGSYVELEDLAADVKRVWSNTRTYNGADSQYSKHATVLERLFTKLYASHLKPWEGGATPAFALRPKPDPEDTYSQQSKKVKRVPQLVSAHTESSAITQARKREAKNARQNMKANGSLPCEAGDYRVLCWGSLSNAQFHDEKFLYPVGYRCTVLLVHPVPQTEQVVMTEYMTEIRANGRHPRFTVTRSTGGAHLGVAEGPQKAWADALTVEAVIDPVYQHLRRCRAVLTWLVTRDNADVFCDAVDVDAFPDYLETVQQPTCLRFIDAKLNRTLRGLSRGVCNVYEYNRVNTEDSSGDGETSYYANEFEFAAEVRLVWANCQIYNDDSSTLSKIATELAHRFENVFCDWVINQQGNSSWEEWAVFRPFESEESLAMVLQRSVNLVDPEDEDTEMDLNPSGKSSRGENSYYWEPVPGVVPGWMQQVGRPSSKTASKAASSDRELMCPNGRRYLSSERPATLKTRKQMKGSKGGKDSVDEAVARHHSALTVLRTIGNLVKNCALVAPKLQGSKKRSVDLPPDGHTGLSQSIIHALLEGLPQADACHDYELQAVGELYKTMEKEARAKEASDQEARAIDSGLQKRLHDEQVYFARKRSYSLHTDSLPLLPSEILPSYQNYDMNDDDDMETDEDFDDNVVGSLGRIASSMTETTETNKEAAPSVQPRRVPPVNVSQRMRRAGLRGPDQLEDLLMIWDFTCSFHEVLGCLPLPLHHFLNAFTISGARDLQARKKDESAKEYLKDWGAPSLPALHLNELGALLTRTLLLDLVHCLQLRSQRDHNEFFALKPVNILTWPELARQYLAVVTQYRNCGSVNSSDTMRWLRGYPQSELNPCLDLLAVLCAHPLVTPFLDPVDATQVAGYSDIVSRPMDLSAVRRKLYTYESAEAFAVDVRLIWKNCQEFNAEGTYLWRSAACLSVLFEKMYGSWVKSNKSSVPAAGEVKEATTSLGVDDSKTLGNGGNKSVLDSKATLPGADGAGGNTPPATDKSQTVTSAQGMGEGKNGERQRKDTDRSCDPALIHPSFFCAGQRRRSKYVDTNSSDKEDEQKCAAAEGNGNGTASERENASLGVQKESEENDWSDDEDHHQPLNSAVTSPVWFGYRHPFSPEAEDGRIDALASTLYLLREKDPEEWTASERVTVLSMLTNQALDTYAIREAIDAFSAAKEMELPQTDFIPAKVEKADDRKGEAVLSPVAPPEHDMLPEGYEYESLVMSPPDLKFWTRFHDKAPTKYNKGHHAAAGDAILKLENSNDSRSPFPVTSELAKDTPPPSDVPVWDLVDWWDLPTWRRPTDSPDLTTNGDNMIQDGENPDEIACFVCGSAETVSSQRWVCVPEMLVCPIESVYDAIAQRQAGRVYACPRCPDAHPQRHQDTTTAVVGRRAHEKCCRALGKVREYVVFREKLVREKEVAHWNGHLPGTQDHVVSFRAERLGKDVNGVEYWMFGHASGQLLARQGSNWGLYDIPYRVWEVWSTLKDEVECEWLLRRKILEELTSKNGVPTDVSVLTDKRRRLLSEQVESVPRKLIRKQSASEQSEPEAMTAMAVKTLVAEDEVLLARVVELRYSEYLEQLIEARRKNESSNEDCAQAELKLERRKAREDTALGLSELHPTKGWLRSDLISTLLVLRAETSATRHLTEDLFNRQLRRTAGLPLERLNRVVRVDDKGFKVTALGTHDSRYKPVVQVDLASQEGIHFWMSGTEASRQVNVAQSAISLCARGGRREAGGFGWRFATEQDIAAARAMNLQTDNRSGGAEDGSTPLASPEGMTSTPLIPTGNKTPVPDVSAAAAPETHVSHILCSPKLHKLKSELLNMGSALPVSKPHTKELQSASLSPMDMTASRPEVAGMADSVVTASNESYSKGPITSNPVYSENNGDSNGGEADEDVLQLDLRGWTERVRAASTPGQLLEATKELENALPGAWVSHWWKTKAFSEAAHTVAAVASRVYALDRAIKLWDQPRDSQQVPLDPSLGRLAARLRPFNEDSGWLTCFSHMCHNAQLCLRGFNHGGKCNQSPNGITRAMIPLESTAEQRDQKERDQRMQIEHRLSSNSASHPGVAPNSASSASWAAISAQQHIQQQREQQMQRQFQAALQEHQIAQQVAQQTPSERPSQSQAMSLQQLQAAQQHNQSLMERTVHQQQNPPPPPPPPPRHMERHMDKHMDIEQHQRLIDAERLLEADHHHAVRAEDGSALESFPNPKYRQQYQQYMERYSRTSQSPVHQGHQVPVHQVHHDRQSHPNQHGQPHTDPTQHQAMHEYHRAVHPGRSTQSTDQSRLRQSQQIQAHLDAHSDIHQNWPRHLGAPRGHPYGSQD